MNYRILHLPVGLCTYLFPRTISPYAGTKIPIIFLKHVIVFVSVLYACNSSLSQDVGEYFLIYGICKILTSRLCVTWLYVIMDGIWWPKWPLVCLNVSAFPTSFKHFNMHYSIQCTILLHYIYYCNNIVLVNYYFSYLLFKEA